MTNRDIVVKLVESIPQNRYKPSVDAQKLIHLLDVMGYFDAPASTRFHSSYKGGLCQHCLNTYNTLLKIVSQTFHHEDDEKQWVDESNHCIFDESIIIVALFHDIEKSVKYKETYRNEKVYSPSGSKFDELGNFDWKSVPSYALDDTKRMMFGTHEENSLWFLTSIFELCDDEAVAILNHSGYANKNGPTDLTGIFEKYPLALYLHLSDMYSSYYLEPVKR